MTHRTINPETLSRPTGYSHVAVVEAGRQVHVSGQVALDAGGQVVGKGDLAAQAEQVFANLAHALAAAGAELKDLFKIVNYVVDLTPEKAAVLRAVRFGPHPASSMVGVTSLVHPDWLLEIEGIASLRS